MITLHEVGFAYQSTMVLKDINFCFEAGKQYMLIGDNGIGKTTLIKLILDLFKPTEGSIDRPQNCVFSYLPDSNGIYDYLTVMQNIKFRLGIYNIRFDERAERAERLLQQFHMLKYKDAPVSRLSLGLKKKTAIICAMLVDADVLIMDEPTIGLDIASKKQFGALMQHSHSLITICISHDLELMQSGKFQILRLEKDGFRYAGA